MDSSTKHASERQILINMGSIITLTMVLIIIVSIRGPFVFGAKVHTVKATITSIKQEKLSDNTTINVCYLDYYYNGKEYNNIKYDSYESSLHVGQEIKILIFENHPTTIYALLSPTANKIDGDTIAFVSFGLILAFVPFALAFFVFKDNRKYKKKGKKIIGIIEDIRNNPILYQGQHPIDFICSYEDYTTNEKYTFKNTWYGSIPSNCINIGDTVDIYVMPENYSKYYVDLPSRLALYDNPYI